GQPWTSRSGGPSPASATWRSTPLALMVRWRTPATGGRSSSLTSTHLDSAAFVVPPAGKSRATTAVAAAGSALPLARRPRLATDGWAETSVCHRAPGGPARRSSLWGGAPGTPSNPGAHMKRAATTTPLPYEGTAHQTLSAYIQARFDEFSRSQKD